MCYVFCMFRMPVRKMKICDLTEANDWRIRSSKSIPELVNETQLQLKTSKRNEFDDDARHSSSIAKPFVNYAYAQTTSDHKRKCTDATDNENAMRTRRFCSCLCVGAQFTIANRPDKRKKRNIYHQL